jgi:hypothetical protein
MAQSGEKIHFFAFVTGLHKGWSNLKKSGMTSSTRTGNIVLIALTLFYLIMLGGGNYEHMNITPVITSSPPQSLHMLQGPYGFNPVRFWVTFRPLTIILFIASLILYWKQPGVGKKLLLIAFSIDILITLSTALYFAPETGVITSASTDLSLETIKERALLWKNLNSVRLGAFYIVGTLLLIALNTMPRSRSVA